MKMMMTILAFAVLAAYRDNIYLTYGRDLLWVAFPRPASISKSKLLIDIGLIYLFLEYLVRYLAVYNNDSYHKKDANKGADGDIGYTGEQIKFYIIRSKDKGNIYVQFSANNAAGKLNILQEEALQQTITKVKADDILKDLTEKGKSILYISFDLDKSTISADGKGIVNEIAEALKKNANLKLSIEGHTDNTGEASHNKKLSDDRANSVLKVLTTNGIDKSR